MKLLIVFSALVAASCAAILPYPEADQSKHSGGLPLPSEPELEGEAGYSAEDGPGIDATLAAVCKEGEVLHVDGSCVVPEITRNIYVFEVPEQPAAPSGPPPSIPPPRVDHNILFIRLPDEGPQPEPLVLPPPRQHSIVYVLSKKSPLAPTVIEVPAHPQSDPEVYFVNYQDGENPALPFGVDLETALGAAAETSGQVLGGGSGLGGQREVGLGGSESGVHGGHLNTGEPSALYNTP